MVPLPSMHAAMMAEMDVRSSTVLASMAVILATCIFNASVADQRRVLLASTADTVKAGNVTIQ